MSVWSETTNRLSAFDELVERMRPVCVEAVDVMEIAAVLESDGITDALALSRYGSPDVFDLAERLRRITPRRPAATLPAPSPWRSGGVRHLLRGVLFALPALCYVAVSDIIQNADSAAVLTVSVLLSWAVSQVLAYLGHVRLGWQDRPGAGRVLLGGLIVGTGVVLAGTAVTGLVLGVPPGVLLVAAAQVIYLLAATVALVLGWEWWLLAALAPGVVAASIGLAVGGTAVLSAPVVIAAATTVVACVVVAGFATRGVRPGAPTRAELWMAAPHALFGVAIGALLLYVPVSRSLLAVPTVDDDTTAGLAGAGLAAFLPLSLSMGLAEWLLVRYRTWTHRALQEAGTLDGFAVRAGAALGAAVVGYIVALAVAYTIAAVVVGQVTHHRVNAVAMLGYLALGGALFLALTLVTFRMRIVAVATCAAAAAAELLCLDGRYEPELLQLGATTLLSVGLFGYAIFALGRATRHL